ncbi:HAD family hydrolase [Enterococcus durans]|uniref:HAD family hydrolase n=1 Tax=Enterococcus durans TaxID=53345 RepID=UPI002072B938|nr:HAD family phosphatase [Enterococcus durans]
MIQLIVLDMDGVLVDSERVHYERRKRFFQQHHFQLTDQQLDKMVGSNANDIWQALIPTDTEKREQWLAIYREDVRANLMDYQAICDVKMIQFVKWLHKKNIACALASSAPRLLIKNWLIDIGLDQEFTVILSGEKVAFNKPNPDIYLKTIEKFPQIHKRDILVIEDSAIGIEAAKNAGLTVAAKETSFIKKVNMDQSQADIRFIQSEKLIHRYFQEINLRKARIKVTKRSWKHGLFLYQADR